MSMGKGRSKLWGIITSELAWLPVMCIVGRPGVRASFKRESNRAERRWWRGQVEEAIEEALEELRDLQGVSRTYTGTFIGPLPLLSCATPTQPV